MAASDFKIEAIFKRKNYIAHKFFAMLNPNDIYRKPSKKRLKMYSRFDGNSKTNLNFPFSLSKIPKHFSYFFLPVSETSVI